MSLVNFTTLQLAKEYPQWTESLIHRDTFNGYLASVKVYSAMKKIARTEGHPAQNEMDAFMDSVDYNFMQNNPTGILQIAAYQSLIDANITIEMNGESVAVSTILGQLKPVVLSRANSLYYPHENATKQDFDIAHGTINRKSVSIEKGFCTILLNADAPEKHNPQIYRRVTFGDGSFEYVRVAGFRNVQELNTYRVQCPIYEDMYVDNAYGVVA